MSSVVCLNLSCFITGCFPCVKQILAKASRRSYLPNSFSWKIKWLTCTTARLVIVFVSITACVMHSLMLCNVIYLTFPIMKLPKLYSLQSRASLKQGLVAHLLKHVVKVSKPIYVIVLMESMQMRNRIRGKMNVGSSEG